MVAARRARKTTRRTSTKRVSRRKNLYEPMMLAARGGKKAVRGKRAQASKMRLVNTGAALKSHPGGGLAFPGAGIDALPGGGVEKGKGKKKPVKARKKRMTKKEKEALAFQKSMEAIRRGDQDDAGWPGLSDEEDPDKAEDRRLKELMEAYSDSVGTGEKPNMPNKLRKPGAKLISMDSTSKFCDLPDEVASPGLKGRFANAEALLKRTGYNTRRNSFRANARLSLSTAEALMIKMDLKAKSPGKNVTVVPGKPISKAEVIRQRLRRMSTSSPLKEAKKKLAPKTPKEVLLGLSTPRHEVKKGIPKKNLPLVLKQLTRSFEAGETVLGLNLGRGSFITKMTDLRLGAQRISKRTYDLNTLRTILHLVPELYRVVWSQGKVQLGHGKRDFEIQVMLRDHADKKEPGRIAYSNFLTNDIRLMRKVLFMVNLQQTLEAQYQEWVESPQGASWPEPNCFHPDFYHNLPPLPLAELPPKPVDKGRQMMDSILKHGEGTRIKDKAVVSKLAELSVKERAGLSGVMQRAIAQYEVKKQLDFEMAHDPAEPTTGVTAPPSNGNSSAANKRQAIKARLIARARARGGATIGGPAATAADALAAVRASGNITTTRGGRRASAAAAAVPATATSKRKWRMSNTTTTTTTLTPRLPPPPTPSRPDGGLIRLTATPAPRAVSPSAQGGRAAATEVVAATDARTTAENIVSRIRGRIATSKKPYVQRRTSDPRPSDPRTSDPRPSDPRPSDPRTSDPRPSDPRPSDPRTSDPRSRPRSANKLRRGNRKRGFADATAEGEAVPLVPPSNPARAGPTLTFSVSPGFAAPGPPSKRSKSSNASRASQTPYPRHTTAVAALSHLTPSGNAKRRKKMVVRKYTPHPCTGYKLLLKSDTKQSAPFAPVALFAPCPTRQCSSNTAPNPVPKTSRITAPTPAPKNSRSTAATPVPKTSRSTAFTPAPRNTNTASLVTPAPNLAYHHAWTPHNTRTLGSWPSSSAGAAPSVPKFETPYINEAAAAARGVNYAAEAPKSLRKVDDEEEDFDISSIPKNLRHLPIAMLKKMKGRAKARKILKDDTVVRDRLAVLDDLFYLVTLLRGVFISARKTAMPLMLLLPKLERKHRDRLSVNRLKELIEELVKIAPKEFCSLTTNTRPIFKLNTKKLVTLAHDAINKAKDAAKAMGSAPA